MAAINRVKWAGSGLQLAAGDDEGYIYIYDVGEVCSLNYIEVFLKFQSSKIILEYFLYGQDWAFPENILYPQC